MIDFKKHGGIQDLSRKRGVFIPMERALSFISAPEYGESVYTNAEALWQPLWGRGIFGGSLVAQSLVIAQHTVPSHLLVHSTHCTFISAANNDSPIFYHVRNVPKGRNSATVLVEARQVGRCVFIAVISFLHGTSSANKKTLKHQVCVPLEGAALIPPSKNRQPVNEKLLSKTCQANSGSLYECVRLPMDHQERRLELRRLWHWIRTRDHIGNYQSSLAPGVIVPPSQITHLAALAYMTDNYFIGTTSRIHHANRFNNRHAIKSIISAVMGGASSARDLNELSSLTYEEAVENSESGAVSKEERGNIEMMVSLDHTIFFHNQATVRADVWMFSEMESPWTGDERSLVVQRVWSSQGTLLATCFQEGAIRLLQDTPQSKI